jgi:hypothetical protein
LRFQSNNCSVNVLSGKTFVLIKMSVCRENLDLYWSLSWEERARRVAVRGASAVVGRPTQIHGGYAVTKDFPFEIWYREMKVRRTGEGLLEMQGRVIARDILRSSRR